MAPWPTCTKSPEKTKFVVHSYALGRLSDHLDRLMSNGMSESISKVATWQDVEVEDFERLVQFGYMNDYTVPNYGIGDSEEGSIVEAEIQNTVVGLTNLSVAYDRPVSRSGSEGYAAPKTFSKSRMKKLKKKKSPISSMFSESEPELEPSDFENTERTPFTVSEWGLETQPRSLKLHFDQRNFCPDLPNGELLDSCNITDKNQPTMDYDRTLRAHARLYVLAEQRMIFPLKHLVLHKMHRILTAMELFQPRLEAVILLIQYVYSDGKTNENDELRALLTVYIESRIEKFKDAPEFEELFAEGGEFARDFWRIHKMRICE